MKTDSPKVVRTSGSERKLGHAKADTGIPKKRLRGLAMEFAAENYEEFISFVEDSQK